MAKPQKTQVLDLSKFDLGELDASFDQNFLQYAISLPILNVVKSKGKSFIVGPKGSGKTGIRLKIGAELTPKRVINLSEGEGFELKDLGTNNPNSMKKKIEAYIIGRIFEWVCINKKDDADNIESFRKKPFYGFLKKVAESTKLKTPFFEIAIGDLFPEEKKNSVSYLLSSDFTDWIRQSVKDEGLFVLIDDIDMFVSTEQGPERRVVLEQLLYAVFDLNLGIFKRDIWVVAFLKSEIFREIRKVATELDKVRQYIEPIAWSSDNLKLAVKDRIEWNVRQQGLDGTEFPWIKIFAHSSEKEIDAFFDKLLSMAVNGPRNAFDLMRRCLNDAAKSKDKALSEKHIDNVIFQYGEDVLNNLSSFYQQVYPDIDGLIDIVFRGFDSEFKRNELENRIKSEFLFDSDKRRQFGHTWPAKSTAFKLIEIFYEIGIIGVLHKNTKQFAYSFAEPEARLAADDKLNVHPGLRSFLETS